MIVVIPFCHKDRLAAIRLLEWWSELDGVQVNHKLVLLASNPCTHAENLEVAASGRKAFADVSICHQTQPDESGWPKSCTTLFRLACDHMKVTGTHWLWCEPDCTPLVPGSLDALDTEYLSNARPFMGAWHNQPVPHLTGNAIYPANPILYNRLLFSRKDAPWDLVNPGATLAQAHLTKLIQHSWSPSGHDLKAPAWHFDSPYDLDRVITQDAVLFHRCKDGSLIDCLRQRHENKPGIIERIKTYFSNPEITVVITNFNRPDKVRHAFTSCIRAHVKNIVISASGCGSELQAMHDRFRKEKSDVVIDAIPNDRGCNEMWLRGVRLAKTKWVHLLHDDDMLLPEFETIGTHLNNGASFYHWNAAKHAWPQCLLDGCNLLQTWFAGLADGMHSTDILWPTLLADNAWSISPVGGLFTREHVLETLEEFDLHYRDCRFFFKAKMQAGNDLLIWLRAAEKYPSFDFISRPLISYGHWDGSASYLDHCEGIGLLSKIYNATREQFLTGPPFDMMHSPRLVHIQTDFVSPDERDRVKFALERWGYQYRHGNWARDVIHDAEMPRLFKDGNRKIPYLRDMIDLSVSRSSTEDPIFVLTNTDTIPVNSITRHLIHSFRTHNCAYSFRRDIKAPAIIDDKDIRMKAACFAGCDLFAFRGKWWHEHRKSFPDMLYATDTWDYCMRTLMDKTGGERFYYLIYHVNHTGDFDRNKNSLAHQHNHSLADPFLRKMGIEPYWISKAPVRLFPKEL